MHPIDAGPSAIAMIGPIRAGDAGGPLDAAFRRITGVLCPDFEHPFLLHGAANVRSLEAASVISAPGQAVGQSAASGRTK